MDGWMDPSGGGESKGESKGEESWDWHATTRPKKDPGFIVAACLGDLYANGASGVGS